MKWYYIAIPVGLILAYLVLRPSSTLGKGTGTGSSAGGTLNGVGNASSGLAKLWGAITGSNSDTADTAEG